MKLTEQQLQPVEVNSSEIRVFASGGNPLKRPDGNDRRRYLRYQLQPTVVQMSSDRRYSLPSDFTEDNPFSKREVYLFVAVYSFCVILLCCLYEFLMPVFNNPTYPYYNHVPDYMFKAPHVQ
ncbi:hypothetical protein TELCIR_01187 [Teladorsagia circumcincta]|uniref:Uncharacterized protein n=1 Tax=Teladorsagia circumcincta TaxID=45464 RepID=A0A2G9V437_TELCI|nr:hypothetical protein TELCIR_01187 [Teladorsagia circumcincta]